MIRVTPNEYLDRRRPEWIDAEMVGHAHYDKGTRLVQVHDSVPDIQRALIVPGATQVPAADDALRKTRGW